VRLPEFGNGGRYVVRTSYADGRRTEQQADAGRVKLVAPKGSRALPSRIEWLPLAANDKRSKR
jgi:hypothetical protein